MKKKNVFSMVTTEMLCIVWYVFCAALFIVLLNALSSVTDNTVRYIVLGVEAILILWMTMPVSEMKSMDRHSLRNICLILAFIAYAASFSEIATAVSILALHAEIIQDIKARQS